MIWKELRERGYFCTPEFASAVEAALGTRPVAGAFLSGPAGTGKTYLPEVLAEILGIKHFYFYQCLPGTREDDLLVKLIPDEKARSGIKAVDGVVLKAARASRKHRVMLVLDEWDKSRPSADAFLLDFLQSGRINFNGKSCRANLARMTVFITTNYERELSEPLLRRLPAIEFTPLPWPRVLEVLELTHRGHPYLPAAMELYRLSLKARLPKPATIQELRQLLDAISLLGDRADWDALVFQFVTKTRENHSLLKAAEVGCDDDREDEDRAVLDPERYQPSTQEEAAICDPVPREPQMPRLAPAKGMRSVAETASPAEGPTLDELATAGGVLELTDIAYDTCVGMAQEPGDDPNVLGSVARVVGKKIILTQPLELSTRSYAGFLGQPGEILLVDRDFTVQDLLRMRPRIRIVKFARDEILGKSDDETIHCRWTPTSGLELVIDSKTVTNLREWFVAKAKGRMKKLSPEESAQLIADLKRAGKTHEDFYRALGIPRELYEEWHPKDKDFSDSCSGWRDFKRDMDFKGV